LSTYPSIPTGFKISLVGGGTIGLEWKDNANDEKGYKVYRAINSPDSFTLIAELPKNTETFDDKELETGKMYWYKISAFNDNGEIYTPTLTLPEEPSFPYASSVNL
jgi:fibronectin type 3 domain-containing protein